MSSVAGAADAPEEFAALADYAVDDFMSEAASDVEVFATTESHGDVSAEEIRFLTRDPQSHTARPRHKSRRTAAPSDPEFTNVGAIYTRLKTFMLVDDELFGEKLSSKTEEVVSFLNEKMKGSVRALGTKGKTMMRLIECAKRKGELTALAKLLVRSAEKAKLGSGVAIAVPDRFPG